METTNDGSDMVQHQLDLLEKKYKNVKMNLLFGRYLLDMNYLAKAESYFQMLLRELKSSNNEQYYHEDLALVNSSLGELHLRATNYNKAYEYLTAAYIIQSENRTANNLFTSDISFGNYYKAIGSPLRAYTYYKEALRKMNENPERNRININIVNINIASTYAIHGDYCESRRLCLEAGNSLRQIQSTYPLYSEMIICQGIIADNYFKEKKYEEAGTYYRNAFNMCKQYFCLGDKQMVHCIRSLTEFYRKKYNDGDQHAIRFCRKQLELHQQHLSENHPSVAHLLMKLGDIKQDVSYYEKAVGILRRNDFLEYLSIAQCYKFIGDYYFKNEINRNVREARVNYCRTRQIYEQIYPEDHQCIVEIQDSINSIVQTSS
jgi:tetratricopeptide (TPR) repeat protein